MIVTSIKTSQGVVSLDGEHDDEYSLGIRTYLVAGHLSYSSYLLSRRRSRTLVVSTMVIRQVQKQLQKHCLEEKDSLNLFK